MNIIFLDFDGVICNPSTCIAVGNVGGLFSYLDPISCNYVKMLCEKHNCKLVISSTWRILHDRMAIKAILNATCPNLGNYVYNDEKWWRTESIGSNRGVEINSWICQNSDKFDNYVILDDDDDMGDLLGSLVQTDGYNGMDFYDYNEAVQILKGNV